MFCALAGHRPSPTTIENAGHLFTRCARCAADLIQLQGRWQSAPSGFRIVWRAAAPGEAVAVGPGADAPVEAQRLDAQEQPLLSESETLDLELEAVAPSADADLEAESLDFEVETREFQVEALLDEAMATEPAEAPAPAPERRGVDRRAPPGTQPKFTGVDRRRGDRRGSFGRNRRPGPAAPGAEPAAEAQ
jgi:hypothetical protein